MMMGKRAPAHRIVTTGLAILLVVCASACGRASGESPLTQCPAAGSRTSSGPATGLVRPVFFISDLDGCGARAFTFTGERTDRRLIFPPCREACSRPMIAPDGSLPTASTAPRGLLSALWAPDSRRMCGLLEGYAHPVRVGSFDAGNPQNVHVSTFAGLFGGVRASQFNLLSCNPAADRAVLTATGNGVVAVAVVSLAKQKVLFEQDHTDSTFAVVVAPNGLDMAIQHAELPPRSPSSPAPATCQWSTRHAGKPQKLCMVSPLATAPSPVPTDAELFSLTGVPHPTGRIRDRAIAGWSGDGTRLIAQTPNGQGGFSGLQVLRASDRHVLWQTAETLNGQVSAPGLTSLVVQTYDALHKKTTIQIIDALGRPKRLDVKGQLVTGP